MADNSNGRVVNSSIAPHWRDGYAAYGVRCNGIEAAELFRSYMECGFLYPAKHMQLQPYLDGVVAAWNASMAEGEGSVHHVLTSRDEARDAWGSVSFWRSTNGRVHSQHLVSSGWPGCSRQVMLAAQDWCQSSGVLFSENWFRTENKYPNRIFGSVPERLGPLNSTLDRRALFAASRDISSNDGPRVDIHVVDDSDAPLATGTLRRLAGPVVAAAEEFDSGDIRLGSLDDVYRRVGLRRTRQVSLAMLANLGSPVGVASAYRGPLGLNFSFLENRCDLWLDACLDETERRSVAVALIRSCLQVYEDCPLPYVLIACDAATLESLLNWTPGQHVRTYTRCIWTREGFWEWYCHVDSFYGRIMQLEERRQARVAEQGSQERPS